MNNKIAAMSAMVFMCALILVLVGMSFIADKPNSQNSDALAERVMKRSLATNLAASVDGSPIVVAHSRDAEKHQVKSTLEIGQTTNETRSIQDILDSGVSGNSNADGSLPPDIVQKDPPSLDWMNPSNSIPTIKSTGELQNRDWVYGWLQLQTGFDRTTLETSLKRHGTTLLGFSGLYARARIPTEKSTLENLASDPHVAGFGMQPYSQKTTPQLRERFSAISDTQEHPVFITVLANEDSVSLRKSLTEVGLTVGQWFGDIRSYSANLPINVLDDVLQRDDVEEISANEVVSSMLDSANAVVGIDAHRRYQSATDSFEGTTGHGIAVGVMDTGINLEHIDFSLKDVCGANFLSNDSSDEDDLFTDQHGHGSHVTGIIAGEGKSNTHYAGVAPGVKQIRFAKVLNTDGAGSYLDIFNAVKFLREENPCDNDSSTVVPSLVNVSLGGNTDFSDGNSLLNRKLDATIYDYDQSYVLAAGNSGLSGISDIGSTKNSITVGVVFDSGVPIDFSSHGPTTDGRLSPHVAAPGGLVTSVEGDSSRKGYVEYSGTSMAAPAVAGLMAAHLEANDWGPALIRAVLMASAIRPEPFVGTMDGFPINNTNGPGKLQEEYGLGLVTATQNWVAGDQYERELTADEEFTVSITVPEDVARLDVVLTWIEPPSAQFTHTVLSNLDLYLDEGADCGEGACGEHSSQSTIDSNEWILLKDPEAGEYTIKVVPVNDFTEPAKIGLAWRAIEKDDPKLDLQASDTQVSIRPNESFELDLEISVDAFIAAGTTVHLACDGSLVCSNYDTDSPWHPSSHGMHHDGTYQLLSHAPNVPISVGEVSSDSSRRLHIRVPRGLVSESHTLYFVASSFNAHSATVAINVEVDGAATPDEESPPANDMMQEAIILTGMSGDFDINLRLASREPGERMVQGRGGDGNVITKFFQESPTIKRFGEYAQGSRHSSAWYELNSPSNVGVLSVSNIPIGTEATVFEATPDGMKSIYEHGGGNAFTAKAEESKRYLLQLVHPTYNADPANISWSFREKIQPSNDDFDDAHQIAESEGSVEGTNFNSSLEGFEFYGLGHNESTWYKWTSPTTATFEFNANPGIALVFKGSNSDNLTRISSLPASTEANIVHAAEGEQYYIAVVSSSDQGSVNDFELSWSLTSNSLLMDNDNYSAASTLSGESGTIDESIRNRRTLEPNEPDETGLGTLWWSWTPSTTGSYTFELEEPFMEHLSLWTGDSLAELTLVSHGTVLSVDATAEQTYYLAFGTDHKFAFNDLQNRYSRSVSIAWGSAPANDLRINAVAIEGISGSTSFSHRHATTSRDDLKGITGTHSLWWNWTAPYEGWFKFELNVQNDRPYERQVDNVLGILKADSDSQFIATTDRSYVLNGKPETAVFAVSGEEYVLQVSLRTFTSRQPFAETSLSWSESAAPPWLKYLEHLTSNSLPGMTNVVESLIEPRSIAIDGASNTLYVIAATGLVVLTTDSDTGSAQYSKLVEYKDADGTIVDDMDVAILGWDHNNSALYALNKKGLYLFQELDSESPHVQSCIDHPGGSLTNPTQLFIENESKFFYAIDAPTSEMRDSSLSGLSMKIESYERTGSCEFSPTQTVDDNDASPLRRGTAASIGPDQDHFYVASDDGLMSFTRDTTTGELQYVSIAPTSARQSGFRSLWNDSTLLASGSGDHLFVMGKQAPFIAAYDIESDPGNPSLVSSIDEFHVHNIRFDLRNFETKENLPINAENCTTLVAPSDAETTHVLCDDAMFSLTIEEDQLVIQDMLLTETSDRFGDDLRDVSIKRDGFTQAVMNQQNTRTYVIVPDFFTYEDFILSFERASHITGDPY